MDIAMQHYLADAIVRDLRDNRTLPADVATSAYRFPLIDRLRERLTEADWRWIYALTLQLETPMGKLATGLLQPFRSMPAYVSHLQRLWAASTDCDFRYNLVFRLMDVAELSQDLQRECFDFVFGDLDRFAAARLEWYGGAARVLEGLQRRLSDCSFPPSKRWLYLASALGASDRGAARSLIAEYRGRPDSPPLVVEGANALLQRLA